jgi:ABC-type microcin C transport system permease subunit YejE
MIQALLHNIVNMKTQYYYPLVSNDVISTFGGTLLEATDLIDSTVYIFIIQVTGDR